MRLRILSIRIGPVFESTQIRLRIASKRIALPFDSDGPLIPQVNKAAFAWLSSKPGTWVSFFAFFATRETNQIQAHSSAALAMHQPTRMNADTMALRSSFEEFNSLRPSRSTSKMEGALGVFVYSH